MSELDWVRPKYLIRRVRVPWPFLGSVRILLAWRPFPSTDLLVAAPRASRTSACSVSKLFHMSHGEVHRYTRTLAGRWSRPRSQRRQHGAQGRGIHLRWNAEMPAGQNQRKHSAGFSRLRADSHHSEAHPPLL